MPGREVEKYDKSKVEGKQIIWIMGKFPLDYITVLFTFSHFILDQMYNISHLIMMITLS